MTIRNDATRLRLRPRDARTPRAVGSRQGQVLLDTDVDSGSDATIARLETETRDSLSPPGQFSYPVGGTGFLITPAMPAANIQIGSGHGYLEGRLLENPVAATLATQPHPRNDVLSGLPVALALKSILRFSDPVEEPAWADPALGDAQAAGRVLNDWQVMAFTPEGALTGPAPCAELSATTLWSRLIEPSTGTMEVVPDQLPPSSDPCSLLPQGGYSRLENLLYRIEVHGGTTRAAYPTFDGPRFTMTRLLVKFSRRNASVMARVTAVTGTTFTTEQTALDPQNWFSKGQYAELVTPHDDIDPRDATAAERLFLVTAVTDKTVTLDPAGAALAARVANDLAAGWYLRLWDAFPDGKGLATVSASSADPNLSDLVELGDGIKLRFGGGATAIFRRADFWTFEARADGQIGWPTAKAETPHGPVTLYAPLAVLGGSPTAVTVQDCRVPLANLTDRVLYNRGGDGQSMPLPASPTPLPGKLRVSVQRGKTPVASARIRWQAVAAAPCGVIAGVNLVPGGATTETLTLNDGTCEIDWRLDVSAPLALHKVEAVLLTPLGQPEPQSVIFTASFNMAATTSVQPIDCPTLKDATTVQQALTLLCEAIGTQKSPKTLLLRQITLIEEQGQTTDLMDDKLILNGTEVPFNAFDDGIAFVISGGRLETEPQPFDPIVEVSLDLPYPITDPDRLYWLQAGQGKIRQAFATQQIRLDGFLKVETSDDIGQILWRPTDPAKEFLKSLQVHRGGQRILRDGFEWVAGDERLILVRLRLRSAHVFGTPAGERETRIWLNAEHLGTKESLTGRELLIKALDPQRAADLDMFFYLNLKP